MVSLVISIAKNMVLHSKSTVSQAQEEESLRKYDELHAKDISEKASSYSPLTSSKFKESEVKTVPFNAKVIKAIVEPQPTSTLLYTLTRVDNISSISSYRDDIKSEFQSCVKNLENKTKIYEPLNNGIPYVPIVQPAMPTPPSHVSYISSDCSVSAMMLKNFAYNQACSDYIGTRSKAELAWKPYK
jgi:hypothetical protein